MIRAVAKGLTPLPEIDQSEGSNLHRDELSTNQKAVLPEMLQWARLRCLVPLGR